MSKAYNRRNFLGLIGISPLIARVADVNNTLVAEQTPRPVPDAVKNTIADILETKTISIEPGRFPAGCGGIDKNGHPVQTNNGIEPNRYLGWPTVVLTKDNELLVAYSGDRDSHVCPFGKTQLLRSLDNGKTWSAPTTITNSPLDDRDAGIIQTKKGTLVVSWFTSLAFENPAWKGAYNKYARIGEKISGETKKEWLGNWTKRSLDGGKTWQVPSRTAGTAPHGPVNLKSGDLLYAGTGKYKSMGPVLIEKSTDDGRTWKVIGSIPLPENAKSISEPHVIECSSGKLLAMIRNESKAFHSGHLLQSESHDGGKTWTLAKETGIWGYPPHLTRLKNNVLLLTYGHRKPSYSQRACLSYDEGKTWDIENEVILTGSPNGDMGYPSTVQLMDGSLLTVYYQSPGNGQPTNILSTHWRLKG
ncbi:sialidase family protein [Niabella aurantiaca]|uniref:sialidase family protein n=1 Tax=Niabella aurantiaca TaxID=379900 RepID=UPI00037B9F6E|nr:sialidase family protein [Niabella aurantiaca]